MSLTQLHDHIHLGYHSLRRGIWVLGFIFPPVLVFVGLFFGVILQDSMSAYYHTLMRDVYVGLLCTIGFLLHIYKGYSAREDRVLNLAGIFAFLTAILPTGVSRYHGICAIIFFVCIAYVCIFCSYESLKEFEKITLARKLIKKFKRIYILLGSSMVVLPLIILSIANNKFSYTTLIIEVIAVWVFSYYWLIKSKEMRIQEKIALKKITP